MGVAVPENEACFLKGGYVATDGGLLEQAANRRFQSASHAGAPGERFGKQWLPSWDGERNEPVIEPKSYSLVEASLCLGTSVSCRTHQTIGLGDDALVSLSFAAF
jgi:hypothetical protein